MCAAYSLRITDARRALRSEAQKQMNRRLRQALASLAVFALILAAVISVDDRVQQRFGELFLRGDGVSPWGDRIGDLGGALISALRHQSIENAPLLVFAAVGCVLFVFMVRA